MKKLILTTSITLLTLPAFASEATKSLDCISNNNQRVEIKVQDIRNPDQASGTYDADLSIKTETMGIAAIFKKACSFIVGSRPINYKVIQTQEVKRPVQVSSEAYRPFMICNTGKLSLVVNMRGKSGAETVEYKGNFKVHADVEDLSALKFDQIRKKIQEGLNTFTSYKVDYGQIESSDLTCSFK